MVKYLLNVIFLLFSLHSFSENDTKTLNHIDLDNGLSQNYVSSIIQDKIGYMWFGTSDGLNRYDGYTFKVFYTRTNDSTSLGCNQIKKLALGKDGLIWIGTYNGLNCYNPSTNKFKRYSLLSPKSGSNEISFLVVDKEGLIWLGYNNDAYIICLNPGTQKAVLYPIPVSTIKRAGSSKLIANQQNSFTIISCNKSDDNKLWFGTKQGVIVSFDLALKRFSKQLLVHEATEIYAVVDISNDDLCVGTFNKGVCIINAKSGKRSPIYNIVPQDPNRLNFYWDIIKAPNGNLWLGTLESGIFEMDLKKKTLKQVLLTQPSDYRIFKKGVCSIFIDKSGLLWCGTSGYGLYTMPLSSALFNTINQGFRAIKQKYISSEYEISLGSNKKDIGNTLSFQSIRGIWANDSYLWVGGYWGLDKIDKQTGKIITLNDTIVPYVIKKDRDNPKESLWLGIETMGNSLYRLSIKTDKLTPVNINCDHIFSLLPDDNHILWIGTINQLIKYNTLTGKAERFNNILGDPNSLQPGAVRAIVKDKLGSLWVGTIMGGISRFDEKNRKFIHYRNNPYNSNSLSSDMVLFIDSDLDNNLWIGTAGGGLNKLDATRKKFTWITSQNGLPNDVVYSALNDHEGNLWLSTNKGICKFNPSKMTFNNYYASDGLQGNEFNAGSFFKDQHGTIYFGGINGLTYFAPGELIINKFTPPVIVSSIKMYNDEVIFDQPLTELKELNLSHKDKVFSISFAALNFYQSVKNKYKYRLLGLSPKWIDLGSHREITFNGLNEGHYILEVSASNNDGVWTKYPLRLKINIANPFWKMWWFYVVCLLLIICATVGYNKFRLHSFRKFNKLLTEEVQNRTQEITDQKQEIETQKEIVDKINKELERANISKDKFFSIIAHDLKSPFNSILGLSSMLNDEYDDFSDQEKRTILKNIFKASETTYQLLENLLEWARVQTGKIAFNPQNISLFAISQDNLALLKSSADSKNIRLHSTIGQEAMAYVDENMVSTVVRNFISNSIKFTPSGGTIHLSTIEKEEYIELSITDNGIGIQPDLMGKLFNLDTFHQGIGTNNETGTGLGLIICKEFIERNGGKIHVESSPGMGSTFSFTLPRYKIGQS